MKKRPFPALYLLSAIFLAQGVLFPAGTSMDEKFRLASREIAPDLIAVRRDIHAHPELSTREKRTAALVADRFRKLGLEVREGIGGTGVLGVLRGGKPGRIVMVRGDMDALPIVEETPVPFASRETAIMDGREQGVMHACGHDIHTTMLLGTAEVLSRFRKDLPGTILFVAQPAEEVGDGAKAMIEDGVFRDITPEAAFAFHVDDTLKTGYVHYTPGWAGANVDSFSLAISSEGCHGADPASCVDPIVVGSQIVLDLQVMIARQLDVRHDTVITVGSFHAGSATNIIPREARLLATIRTYGDDQRALVKDKVTRLITSICGASGAPFDLAYDYGTPALYNDPKLLGRILPTAERILGGKQFLIEDVAEMGGEDFSEFAKLVPAVMLDLGVVPKDVARTSVHSPTFIADEDAIPLGVTLMSSILWDYLKAK
jgi:amidohydrolase